MQVFISPFSRKVCNTMAVEERARESPIIFPFGPRRAVKTAKLAGEPDRGCTLTPHSSGLQPKAFRALDWQRRSI